MSFNWIEMKVNAADVFMAEPLRKNVVLGRC
jgi:hypothetical protein